jgi:hypothetical protein
MTKPKSFNVNSDYATTQNDAKGSLSYNIPNGTVIPNGATTVFEANINLGKRNAYMRPQANTSAKPDRWFSCTTMITDVQMNIPGIGITPWFLYNTLERTSPTSLRAYVEIFNNSGDTMTIASGGHTVTWEVNTFLSPFPA